MTKAGIGVTCLTTFAVTLGICVSALDAATNDGQPPVEVTSGSRGVLNLGSALGRYFADSIAEPSITSQLVATDVSGDRVAQFALPKQPPASEGEAPAEVVPAAFRKDLRLEYSFGTEAEIPYFRNRDLDSSLLDNTLIVAPNLLGLVAWRPTGWLETFLEMKAEQPIGIQEESVVTLPDGSMERKDPKPFSLRPEQIYVRLKRPIDLTVGRRNFEDARLWLYDTQLDGIILTFKPGNFRIEASVTREESHDLDLTANVPTGRIDNYHVYVEYRGIEDHKLAAYWLSRDDKKLPTEPGAISQDGEPEWFGFRAYGRPTDALSYWHDLAWMGGRDELGRDFSGAGAFDLGGTYRFLDAPLQPSITLGFAYGTADEPNDTKNSEFRQTGLQSNEARFGGVTQFVTYGEAFNPELSNLKILTVGASIRPAAGVFIDFVFNRYRLNRIAEEVRGSSITALMNQVESRQKKDVGKEFDIILGLRNMFGVRGLGLDLRTGWFFPGDAFDREDDLRPDLGVTVFAQFLY